MTPSLRVRVSWLGDVIHDVILSPARDYTLGEDGADFVMPAEVLGRQRLQLVRVRRGRVVIGVALDDKPCIVPTEADPSDASVGFFEMKLGQRFAQSFGDFVVDVEVEPRTRSPVRRFFVRLTGLGYFGSSLSLSAGVLGSAAHFAPPPEELAEEAEREQIVLMQHYLRASAEREVQPGGGNRGGGGKLALGESDGRGERGRHGAKGKSSGSGETLARARALADAQEFGALGLVSASLGSEPGSARGELWGLEDGRDLEGGNSGERESGDDFADHGVNPVVDPKQDRFSTFAVDVDTGSYFFVKRRLEEGALPPLAAVRPEEMLNAFDYGYPGPEDAPGDAPFLVHLDAAPSPFEPGRHFLRVAVQGRRVPPSARPPLHLTYLVDTSGSMQGPDRIGLVQHSLRLLTRELRASDSVALCTYAGGVRELLPPTPAANQVAILRAIDQLDAGGSTAMASGIQLAYALAARAQRPGHESRVVVLSDGDANVGPMRPDEILTLIEAQRRQGITLSTVGFGRGNYRDSTMERLADAGDGNYSYVGSERDAERVFGASVQGMLHVIARDVKIQVEMDPSVVREYRLIGYENRDVADGDYRKDEVDGGEIGSGHSVTALYDLVFSRAGVSPVKVSLRHKPAAGGPGARALESEVRMSPERVFQSFEQMPPSFRFGVSVAAFAEVLRGSPRALGWSLERVAELSRAAHDGLPERRELSALVDVADQLRRN